MVSLIGRWIASSLSGYKTYMAAIGLVGLAAYQFSQEQYDQAWATLMLSGVAAGLRDALNKLFKKGE